MLTRRMLLGGCALGVIAMAAGRSLFSAAPKATADEMFEVMHSDDEWKKMLTPDQYQVLRQAATEAPGTSPLLHEKRKGTFDCAGCDLALFDSSTKFDSGTGWPSFWKPL